MKKSRIIISAVLAAALVVGSATVIAEEAKKVRMRMGHQKVEITEEQKAERLEKRKAQQKEMLAKQLEEGKITQEQYDEYIVKVENGEFSFGGQFGRKKDGMPFGNFPKGEMKERKEFSEEDKAEMQAKFKEDLASKLEKGEITEEQYNEMLANIESGKFGFGGPFNRGGMHHEMPERKEISEEEKAEMKEKMVAHKKEMLAKQLEEGKITEEQYNEMLANIESGKFGFGGQFGKNRGGRMNGRPSGKFPGKEKKENK